MGDNVTTNVKRKKKKIYGIKSNLKHLSQEEVRNALLKKKKCNDEAMKVVQTLIERGISQDILINSLSKINQSHFEDIVEERALTKICGYPLCDSHLVSIPTKQYQISTKTNKVYDISERKNFCSSLCYKAGKYLKDQLLTSPLWLRECEEKVNFKLLSFSNNSGSSGQEIDFGQGIVCQKEISKLEESVNKSSICEISSEDIIREERGATHVGDVNVVVIGDSKVELNNRGQSLTDLEQFDKHVNKSININEHVDKFDDQNESLSSPRLINVKKSGGGTIVKEPKTGGRVNKKDDKLLKRATSIERVVLKLEQMIKSWIRIETIVYVLGEEKVKEELRDLGIELKQSQRDAYFYDRYSDLCKKLNFLELEETYGRGLRDQESLIPDKPLPNFDQLKEEAKQLEIKVKSFYAGDTKVSFQIETGDTNSQSNSGLLPLLPLVDHHAVDLTRRQIFIHKLNKVLPDIQTALGLNHINISELLRGFVNSLQLTASNVILKPSEWNIASIVIIKLLSLRDANLANALKCEKASKYLELILMSYSVHTGYLDRLTSWILDVSSLL